MSQANEEPVEQDGLSSIPPVVDDVIPSTTTAAAPKFTLANPGFLHPSSIIFEVLSQVRQYIVPAIIGLFSAAQGSMWGSGIAAFVFVGSLLVTLIRYFTLRYHFREDEFVVTEGLLFRRVRSVPVRRIQNMDLVQNVLHRIFNVAEVNIETASGTKPEATLRVLTRHEIEELRAALFKIRENQTAQGLVGPAPTDSGLTPPPSSDTVAPADATALPVSVSAQDFEQEAQPVHQIKASQLVLAGLANNRGMVVLGVVVGIFFQADLEERFLDADMFKRWFGPEQDPSSVAWMIALGVITLFVALRIFSIAWYLTRFFDYRLSRRDEDLRISCGLLTRVSATIPRRRIQYISIHRNLLMRWMGLASIRIETAGGAGADNESAATTVSRRWFMPVIPYDQVDRVLTELRPDVPWQTHEFEWHGVSPLAGKRLMRIAFIGSLLFTLVGLAIVRPWGFLAGPALFPLLAWIAIKKGKARRFAANDWGVSYQSGLLTKKLSHSFFDRMQAVDVTQSPFDRRWQMATLRVDTAAAGPAEHRIEVHYLDAKFAFDQFRLIRNSAAHQLPQWN